LGKEEEDDEVNLIKSNDIRVRRSSYNTDNRNNNNDNRNNNNDNRNNNNNDNKNNNNDNTYKSNKINDINKNQINETSCAFQQEGVCDLISEILRNTFYNLISEVLAEDFCLTGEPLRFLEKK
jgi:hypothetical protein